MTLQDFVELLSALCTGETVVLTREQFDAAFAGVRHESDRMQAAMGLAAKASCGAHFGESRAAFATFTKRQRRITPGERPILQS